MTTGRQRPAGLFAMKSQAVVGLASLVAAAMLAAPALAHPHVFVTAKAEIVSAPDGKVTGIQYAWTFDPGYSTYVTQGLDKNNDGQLTPDELQELAKVNAESLADFEYFTVLKTNGTKQAFDTPRDYSMKFDKGQATLFFHLPLKTPAQTGKAMALEVYDPTYFVAFSMAEGDDALRLGGAPKGCAATVTRPKGMEVGQQQKLSESFFEALSAASNYGSNFANRAIVACP